MIGPKVDQPTVADARRAYAIATERDGELCQRCLRYCGPLARDHRQNRMPGNTVASNLNCLGLDCHIWKTEHPRAALEDGWAVPRWADPHEWPARRWFRTEVGTLRAGWALLDDLGGVHEISVDEARRRMEGGVT